MITQQEVVMYGGLPEFPGRKTDECSVGFPSGDGIRIGYSGWGRIDIALDPRLPIDMCVSRMGLSNQFKTVTSSMLLNMVHGDCNLTHAVEGLMSLVAPEGKLVVSFLSTASMAIDATSFLSRGQFESCQAIEKFCFSQPVDHSGLVFQQTFLNEKRIEDLMSRTGFDTRIEKKAKSGALPMSADSIRLDDITDEKWAYGISKIEDSLDVDRPRCIVCGRPATKMDNNRRYFSRYCKDHYYEARKISEDRMLAFYTVVIVSRRTQ